MYYPFLDTVHGQRVKNITSLALGGADLHTAGLGCLPGESTATVGAPLAGHSPPHRTTDLGALSKRRPLP